MNLFSQWFQQNLDIVFFIYGLAFLIMGIAILLQPKKGSEFPLADILWLLAGFAITHGINEELDMWALIKGRRPELDMIRWFTLVASYFFLFEFGRQLIKVHSQNLTQWRRRFSDILGWYILPLIACFIFFSGFASADFWKTGSIWTRYLLGFPGGLLIGLGFFLCSCHDIAKELKLRKYFIAGGASFLTYGILGGLIVPRGDFFPSNYLNNESFMTAVGIPVQVFRTLCAVAAAWAVGGMLKIFNWETRARLEEALRRLEDQLDKNVRLTNNLNSLHEISKDIFTEFDIKKLLRKVADNACKLIGCRYSAICILDSKGGYEYFITSGLEPGQIEDMKKECGLPRGNGVLGYVSKFSNPIRIDDLSKHPASIGFPKGHPHMKTFLGVPIVLHNKIIGMLYFADKSTGGIIENFTDADERLAASFGGIISLAMNNILLIREIENLASFPQKTPYSIMECDMDCNITYQNPAARKLTGELGIRGLEILPRDIYEIAAGLELSGKELSYHEVKFRGMVFGEYIHFVPDKKAVRIYLYDITQQKLAKDEIEKAFQTQKVLNSLLHLSLEEIPLNELLQRSLDVILSVPFVCLMPKGGVLLVEDEPDTLVLRANRNLPVPLQGMCSRVPFGKCLCGRAAKSARIQFADQLDERHENRYDGLTPHGHYNVPIVSKGHVLGVFVLYLQEGHQRKDEEVVFLQSVADTLAGIIERRKVENELKRYAKELMGLAESSNIIAAIQPTEDVYEAICNIVVRNFDIKMAWIGLLKNGSYKVRPVAQAGFEDGYLSNIEVTWDNSPNGNGPTGLAIKSRIPKSMNFIDTDPTYIPWRKEALKRGYKSSMSVPFIDSEARVFGVLNLYSSEPQFFTKKTERLFITFANHAVSAIENRLLIEGLEEKVTERTQELEVARQQAEYANQAKSDFLSNISHEMRTPLTAIMGFSEMLFNEETGGINTQQKEYLGNVLDASEQLLNLINDLLDLSKIEAGKMYLELTECNVDELIEESVLMFKEKVLRHNITLGFEVHDSTGGVIADYRKIKQTLFNLLGNALKFTPANGSVFVRARRVAGDSLQDAGRNMKSETRNLRLVPDSDFIEISVEDTGIGISPEDQKKLFQPFQQIETVLTKKHKGTGLGLAICKNFIELHGGRIWVSSEAGKGSRFVFVIPVKQQAVQDENGGKSDEF